MLGPSGVAPGRGRERRRNAQDRWNSRRVTGGRRARFSACAWLTLALLAAASAPAAPAARAPRPASRGDERPPNFVVILVDDLGPGDLGSHGQAILSTPRLDAMAAGGLRLTQLYSGDASCAVSRATLLTGRHAGHSVLRGAGAVPEDSDSEPTYLARRLRLAGYATGMFGKWGLGSFDGPPGSATATAGRPDAVGFDEFLGFLTHRDAHTHALPPYPLEPGDLPIHPRFWTIVGGDTVETAPARIPFVEEDVVVTALDFVTRHRGEPFFLYLPLNLPHAEYYLPDGDPSWLPFLDANGGSVFPEQAFPGNELFRRPVPMPKATYAALVSRLDADVGRVLDHLAALELTGRTLVVFASDNGPPTDAPFNNPEFFGSAEGRRGFKWELFEGGVRVPGIASWPGRIASGRVSSEPLGLWDLFPTILELAGAAAGPDEFDGVSWVPLLDGAVPTPHDAERPLYWETWNGIFTGQAIRDGSLKLIRTGTADPKGPVSLFDLATDPGETNDLAANPASCAALLQLIGRLNAARVDPPGGGYPVTPLAPLCPLFRDGFESGDPVPWSDVEP